MGDFSSRMYYDDHSEAKLGKVKDPLVRLIKWIKSRSSKEKGAMGCLGGMLVSSHSSSFVLQKGLKCARHPLQMGFCAFQSCCPRIACPAHGGTREA